MYVFDQDFSLNMPIIVVKVGQGTELKTGIPYIGDAHIKFMLKYATKMDVVSHEGLSYRGWMTHPTQDFFGVDRLLKNPPIFFPM